MASTSSVNRPGGSSGLGPAGSRLKRGSRSETALGDRVAAFATRNHIDGSAVLLWLLGCPLIVYLALEGGGYDSIVRNQLGIAVWWFVLAGALAGVLPMRPLNRTSLAALGLFIAFTGWMALGLLWTESAERTLADIGRVATFAGVLILALAARGPRATRRTVAAVGTGIAIVALVALASRLQPAWFADSVQVTGEFFPTSVARLAYPINYWNGVAALLAIGLPLVLYLATTVRAVLVSSLAAAALPAISLTIYLTYSRGGTISALVAVAIFIALAHDRLPKLLTLFTAGTGTAILVAATAQRSELADGLVHTAAARQQGDEMLWMTLAVCAGVGLVQAAITLAANNDLRPAWSRVPKRPARIASWASAVLLFLAALAFNVPGHVSDLWEEFKLSDSTGSTAERLTSFSGNSRYQLWEVASTQHASAPLAGTGSGTYENWFNQAEVGGFVRDAHSLYMETLAELGYIGFFLLIAFLLTVFGAGGWLLSQAAAGRRTQLAAAIAGCVAFCLVASADWMWELAVVPIAFLLLAAAVVSAGGEGRRSRGGRNRKTEGLPRLAVAGLAVAAIVVIAIPMATTSLVRQSQAQAGSGDYVAALTSARDAAAINPAASSPRLQQALIFEAAGLLPAATTAAREATRADANNWRPWQILSRIQAKQGNTEAALRSARRARSLNPS